MATTLTIDRDTERLAREVARVTGKPLETVLREAVAATAAAAGVMPPPRRPVDMDKIKAILARIDALSVRDPHTPEEIIGYDENGLPR